MEDPDEGWGDEQVPHKADSGAGWELGNPGVSAWPRCQGCPSPEQSWGRTGDQDLSWRGLVHNRAELGRASEEVAGWKEGTGNTGPVPRPGLEIRSHPSSFCSGPPEGAGEEAADTGKYSNGTYCGPDFRGREKIRGGSERA